MSIKLPAYLIVALVLVLLLVAMLLGFAVLHTVHPAVLQHALTVDSNVVSHSH